MGQQLDRAVEVMSFTQRLEHYKTLIDADIASYSKHAQKTTLQQYGAEARIEIDAFLNILERGGKRIRGALVMLGYEMSGGSDTAMIVKAARAVEMLHAYILIIDDIQDRSAVRRGGASAHAALAEYHRKHDLAGDAEHFGVSLALNAALAGAHAAQMILADLDAPEELRIKVLGIMNRTMMVTAHGQTGDIMNEVVAEVSEEQANRVLELKTANYTILNPLHVGMVLAGAGCKETDAITEYALNTGRAFQISDDILGTFSSEEASGKSPLDDIRQGKRTLLAVYALKNATSSDQNFLIQMLGNDKLTPAQFERCKQIFVESGALAHARALVAQYVQAAQAALRAESGLWTPSGVQFLHELSDYISARQS